MRKHLDCIVRIIALLAGLYMLVLGFAAKWVGNLTAGLGGNVYISIALLVVAAAILYFVIESIRMAMKACGKHALTISTEGGESNIAIGALEDVLREKLLKQEDIHNVHISLCGGTDTSGPVCELSFKLLKQEDIPNRLEELKGMVREEFSRLIPSDTPLQVSCRVDSIMSEATKDKAAPAAQNSEEFSGPVWTVPPEDDHDKDAQGNA